MNNWSCFKVTILSKISQMWNTKVHAYTVEVTNIFKELDLIECLKNYGWRFLTLYRRHDQNHLQEEEMQRGKMAV